MFDKNKTFKTKVGSKVTIHSYNGADKLYPIVGEIEMLSDDWVVSKWKTDGSCIAGTELDLINKPVSVKAVMGLIRSREGDLFCLGAFYDIEALKSYLKEHYFRAELVGAKGVEISEGEFVNAGNINF